MTTMQFLCKTRTTSTPCRTDCWSDRESWVSLVGEANSLVVAEIERSWAGLTGHLFSLPHGARKYRREIMC
jgi:hypothetical protein